MRIGRAVEHDPGSSYLRIERALKGLALAGELADDKQEAYLDGFAERTRGPSATELAFWEGRRRHGLGVGMDQEGNLVYGAGTAADSKK